ncbi:protein SAWADEE HOMEODOMAIN HOMOLOG 2-like [Magnolia sinica]|uniref:protein SAWADEE HOMEODOMAIN HOMOLOG 2-like n=1 Tax=Magnolia sinica TaxID=86752 RepID=UPI00265B1F96|nr:protein SAWADEE HOMEODOMAIN HOMOLOG 2-like [Magnolia sinica]
MGRPPHGGGPAFRFTPTEVVEMEAALQETDSAIPAREVICSLADKFSASEDRAGKIVVQPKQVLNWFQNRRYAQRVKMSKAPGKLNVSPMIRDESVPSRNVPIPVPVPSGGTQMEFEAKSARDGAWYDVSTFISHRMFETSDPEVRVRFSGFGAEEDEWINVRKCVRQRSLPCEATECAAVVPGDLILCFQEGKEQALYFDAHVLDAQRRRHDVRGCRCRFLVRYDHDQSEEIVPLRKICRRPETDYRLQRLHASKDSASVGQQNMMKDPSLVSSSSDFNSAGLKTRRQRKVEGSTMGDTGTTTSVPLTNETANVETTMTMKVENNKALPDTCTSNVTLSIASGENVQET